MKPKEAKDMSKALLVSGAGTARLNGAYTRSLGAKQRHGCSRPYGQEGGDGTIEYESSFGEWWLTERYAGIKYYFCKSTSSTPPLTGWEVISGAAPAPSLSDSRSEAKAQREAEAKAERVAAERALREAEERDCRARRESESEARHEADAWTAKFSPERQCAFFTNPVTGEATWDAPTPALRAAGKRLVAAATLRKLQAAATVDIPALERAIAAAKPAGVSVHETRAAEQRLTQAQSLAKAEEKARREAAAGSDVDALPAPSLLSQARPPPPPPPPPAPA